MVIIPPLDIGAGEGNTIRPFSAFSGFLWLNSVAVSLDFQESHNPGYKVEILVKPYNAAINDLGWSPAVRSTFEGAGKRQSIIPSRQFLTPTITIGFSGSCCSTGGKTAISDDGIGASLNFTVGPAVGAGGCVAAAVYVAAGGCVGAHGCVAAGTDVAVGACVGAKVAAGVQAAARLTPARVES